MYKTLIAICIFLALSSFKCKLSGGGGTPCEIADCYGHILTGTNLCCKTEFNSSYETILRNNHGSRSIWFAYDIERLVGGNFVYDKTEMIEIPGRTDVQLPCTHIGETQPGTMITKCVEKIRYKLKKVCFSDDPSCKPKPKGPKILAIDCSQDCFEGSNGCTTFSTSEFDSSQKAAIKELADVLGSSIFSTHVFSQDIFTALSFGKSCSNRKTQTINDTLISSGSSCTIDFILPTVITINVTDSSGTYAEEFENIRFDIPQSIIGEIIRTGATQTILNLDIPGSGNLFFTTVLKKTGVSRTDRIKSIIFKNSKIIIQGEDFICFTLNVG